MAGYGNRNRPADGAAQELYAKALALEDEAGTRAVIVTTDMLGFPAALSETIAARVKDRHGIPRERLLFNSSHTHCGPAITGMQAAPAWAMTAADREAVAAYTEDLKEKLVAVIGKAIADLAPARVAFGKTTASFGVHRRMPGGRVWGPNYNGPADHDVPIFRIEAPDGKLRAVAFGYACHPSTLGIYRFHGDYAGSAQKWLEDRHAGAVALFVMGCGGDVKPYPNQTIELADAYGAMLAAAVDAQMSRDMRPIGGKLTAAYDTVALPFAPPPTRTELEERLKTGTPLLQRHAASMLQLLDRGGRPRATYPYPVEAWQFGRDLTLVAMGGEVVSEYALRFKQEFGADNLWTAAYSNDVFGYIPSRRILEEGGYEAGAGSMEFYMQPGPWAPSVEDTVVAKVREMVARVRAAGGR
jgi:hypothetical protein